jgi:hypothetical protein
MTGEVSREGWGSSDRFVKRFSSTYDRVLGASIPYPRKTEQNFACRDINRHGREKQSSVLRQANV